MADFDATARQILEVLDGSRAPAPKRGQAAVRIDDMAELMRISDTLTAAEASGSVTVDDFNALRADVQGILRAQIGIVAALRTRLGR